LLGKVENNAPRYGLGSPGRLAAFLNNAAGYLQRHAANPSGLLHPTFSTPEEKRLKRNAAARKKRAATKTI
jgi:hypothetical protein